SCVIVTTLNNDHNHDLSSEAIQFEKVKQFTEKMQEEDLYSEIQQHRPSSSTIKNDAAHFYDQLLSKQQEDSHWFVEIT
ncbi:6129_t:CDS:2, partial [Cetraspora pellucida]